ASACKGGGVRGKRRSGMDDRGCAGSGRRETRGALIPPPLPRGEVDERATKSRASRVRALSSTPTSASHAPLFTLARRKASRQFGRLRAAFFRTRLCFL